MNKKMKTMTIDMTPNMIHCITGKKDMEQFSFCPSNREVDKNHVQTLIKAMVKNFLIEPIIVNDKGEIIDGQHRFWACYNLGYPLYYIVVKGLDDTDCRKYNTNHPVWNKFDYITATAKLGSESAQNLEDTILYGMELTNMSYAQIIKLVSRILKVPNKLFTKDAFITPKPYKKVEWNWSKEGTFTEGMKNKCIQHIEYANNIWNNYIENTPHKKYIPKAVMFEALIYWCETSEEHQEVVAECVSKYLSDMHKKKYTDIMQKICYYHNRNSEIKSTKHYIFFDAKKFVLEDTKDTKLLKAASQI